ncbi:TonB-dependent receptor domain-containing protein [Sphingobium yanoikuyae]|uniref:TonB-dependent receptor n=1 Tax=Sphingobium yanoikuyae TaxID=13690 RepID=A0A9X7UFS9_SPHYA|nr:TonB-dependent receptor [Sphingobium yanoikuyae]QNG48554.1 TonB-dependent receptor [Sphingobium yanoikuyae]
MGIVKIALMTGAALCMGAICSQAHAQDAQKTYNLPEQDLATALRSVARGSDYQLVADPKSLKGARAPSLAGAYTVEEAVTALLAPSGLTAEIRDRTITLRGREAPSREEATGATDVLFSVTGTRIKGVKISSPVIEVTQSEMRLAGQNDLGEVVRSLPQSFGGGQNPGVTGGTVGIANQNLTGGSSANLRGLGADATLTLLNGHRLSYGSAFQAVDIGAIPVSAVARMDVIPDGASAIYGSDAVGGVINIILKPDYEGLTTAARFGAATDGGDEEQQYSLTAGHRWRSGGLLVAYDYSKSTEILENERDYTDYMFGAGTLLPSRRSHSVLLSGHQEISPDVSAAIDAVYNNRRSSSTQQTSQVTKYVNDPVVNSFAIAPSLTAQFAPAWSATLTGVYGKDKTRYDQSYYNSGQIASRSRGCYCNSVRSIELNAEGKLADLPAGYLRLALGGGYRENEFHQFSSSTNRTVTKGSTESVYAFGEAQLPLISPDMDIGLAYRLSVNAALRFEKYNGIGEVATPKLGVVYTPTQDLDVKASWGKSFKAPTLAQQYQAQAANLYQAALLGGSSFPAGSTAILFSGGNPDLKPEKATSWTVSLNAHPSAIPGLSVDTTYFHIRYKKRIIQPLAGINIFSALSNPVYAQYLRYDPDAATQAEVIARTGLPLNNYAGAAYDPSQVVAIVYNDYINGAEQKIEGVDLTFRYRLDMAAKGALLFQGNGSWLRSRERINADAPETRLAGVIFNPPRFKARGSVGWTINGLSLTAYLNHSGPLSDTRTATPVRIKSQTTADISASYAMDPDALLGAMDVSLTVRNIGNQRPPYAAPSSGYLYYVNYDSTNYSPVGRFVSLSISKTW